MSKTYIVPEEGIDIIIDSIYDQCFDRVEAKEWMKEVLEFNANKGYIKSYIGDRL